jgi:hypothetical protein
LHFTIMKESILQKPFNCFSIKIINKNLYN